jgi:CPA1 family monovalent cation:H+ antiporter
MRGVVTLAAALSLPMNFPGRDIILASAFGVILVTVLVQGTTLPFLIGFFPNLSLLSEKQILRDEAVVRERIANVQMRAIAEQYAQDAVKDAGQAYGQPQPLDILPRIAHLIPGRHPETLEQFEAILHAVRAGRAEVLHLYHSGQITDKIMKGIEQDLDFQEISVRAQLGKGPLQAAAPTKH